MVVTQSPLNFISQTITVLSVMLRLETSRAWAGGPLFCLVQYQIQNWPLRNHKHKDNEYDLIKMASPTHAIMRNLREIPVKSVSEF